MLKKPKQNSCIHTVISVLTYVFFLHHAYFMLSHFNSRRQKKCCRGLFQILKDTSLCQNKALFTKYIWMQSCSKPWKHKKLNFSQTLKTLFERDNGNHNNLKTEIRFTFILSSIVSVSGANLLIDSVEGKHVRVIIKPTLLSLPLGLQLGRSSYLCLLRTARPRYCGICQGGATLYVCVRFRVFFFFFYCQD